MLMWERDDLTEDYERKKLEHQILRSYQTRQVAPVSHVKRRMLYLLLFDRGQTRSRLEYSLLRASEVFSGVHVGSFGTLQGIGSLC
jgi:hypothetical protein